MINNMSIEEKKVELYREFRQFRDLSEDEKIVFKKKISQEISIRDKVESEEFRQAIKANVDEIKGKLLEIKEQLNKKPKVSA
jgi:predicted metal-binding transcription factor (methanogenesis marker protein 9)